MKVLVNDTCDVYYRRKSDGHLVFTSEAQLASISQQVTEEKLKGGIGNRTIALLRSDKEITLNTRLALFDKEYLAMTQGVEVTAESVNVYDREENLKVVDNSGVLEVTITGTPVDNTVTVINANGESEQATIASKVVTIPTGHALEDELVTIVYKKAENGSTVSFNADKFSEKYEVEYKTICYNPDTNEVVSDIYIQFYDVTPSGSVDLSFENGNALTPELSFEASAPKGSNVIGKYIEVPRP